MGLMVFTSLKEAMNAGFLVYDRLPDGGYLVRKLTQAGYALAIVSRK